MFLLSIRLCGSMKNLVRPCIVARIGLSGFTGPMKRVIVGSSVDLM
jgi:hypothetical protein